MSDDKELPPSEKKLRKALEEGQDQPSQEVTSLVSGLVLGAAFYFATPYLAAFVGPLLRLEPLALGEVTTLHGRIMATLGTLAGAAEIGAVLLFAASLAAGLLGNLANRRRPPSFKMPQFSYNPLNQIKQMFGVSPIIATAKLWLVCLLVIATVAYLAWRHLPDAVLGAYLGPPTDVVLAVWLPLAILPLILAMLALSAVVDAVQKHMEFNKNNRMDHEEVKQENKEDNGDPLIKSKRMELAREE